MEVLHGLARADELTYETDQSSYECAEGGGRRALSLHVTPVNLRAHVVVAPGISCMRQAVSSVCTGPVTFIPISGTRLPKVLANVLYQDLLRVVGEG